MKTKFPTFLFQSGNVMGREKVACSFSEHPIIYSTCENLPSLDLGTRMDYVPVGSVEFVRKYCRHMDLNLYEGPFFEDLLAEFYHRKVREGVLEDALAEEFVKPSRMKKKFTGCRKSELRPLSPQTPVLISDYVPFESEFRFYIHDFATGPKIMGWARYDDCVCTNPEPDVDLVEKIAEMFHKNLGPSAYSIDIGWRPDLNRYSLVEVNDAWSLGLYENSDPQSNPPTRRDYAEMLISRWRQLLFCNLP